MEQTANLIQLVKNVQAFVKRCREKNKDLLKIDQNDEFDEFELSDVRTNGSATNKTIRNIDSLKSEKSLNNSKVNFIEYYSRGNHGFNSDELHHSIKDEANECNNETKDTFLEYSDRLGTIAPSIFLEKNNNNEKILYEYKNDNNLDKTKRVHKLKTYDIRSQMLNDDAELLKLYKKLRYSSGYLNTSNKKKQKKNKNKKKKLDKKKKKSIKSKVIDSIPINSFTHTNLLKTYKSKYEDDSSNAGFIYEGSKKLAKYSSKKSYLSSLNSKAFANSISTVSHNNFYGMSMNNFITGILDRLNTKKKTNENHIGNCYMVDNLSETDIDTYRKLTSNKKMNNSSTVLNNKTVLKGDECNIFNDYGAIINNMEKIVKSKKKKQDVLEYIITIINCLFEVYIPKLIGRYEYYIHSLDQKNKDLKQKIKESLDFGDIQYEEIRELKILLVKKTNENKKLNDVISTLKEKIFCVNELEYKNLEYLDEIVMLKNKVHYLENIIEENDHTNKSKELKRIRNNVKTLYNNMKKEMKYINLLKLKYKKKIKNRKFSVKKWHKIIKYNEQELKLDEDDSHEDYSLQFNETINHKSLEADLKKSLDDTSKEEKKIEIIDEIDDTKETIIEQISSEKDEHIKTPSKIDITDDQVKENVTKGSEKKKKKKKKEDTKIIKIDIGVNTNLGYDLFLKLLNNKKIMKKENEKKKEIVYFQPITKYNDAYNYYTSKNVFNEYYKTECDMNNEVCEKIIYTEPICYDNKINPIITFTDNILLNNQNNFLNNKMYVKVKKATNICPYPIIKANENEKICEPYNYCSILKNRINDKINCCLCNKNIHYERSLEHMENENTKK